MKNLISKTAGSVEAVYTHTRTHTHTGNLYVRGKINKNITIFLLFIIFIILNTGNAKAVLQANGNTSATYNLSDWMLNVRKMEEAGGAMGLSETLNSDLTSSSKSNNIDVHMEKNTEYGALVILSASSYGNSNVIVDGQTTTGNATGVVMNINNEWVAAGTVSSSTNYNNSVGRYKNIYTKAYVEKSGDAISQTAGWHGSGAFVYLLNTTTCGFVRSCSGSIFSFHGGLYTGFGNDYNQISYYTKQHATRAVVVSGEGL